MKHGYIFHHIVAELILRYVQVCFSNRNLFWICSIPLLIGYEGDIWFVGPEDTYVDEAMFMQAVEN